MDCLRHGNLHAQIEVIGFCRSENRSRFRNFANQFIPIDIVLTLIGSTSNTSLFITYKVAHIDGDDDAVTGKNTGRLTLYGMLIRVEGYR